MKKTAWKNRIRSACEAAGTYQPFFDSVIESLAEIMELRDDASARYKKSGAGTTVEHTTKTGATNVVKNPALVVIMDCNTQALAYWKELGLTAKSYKQMTGGMSPQNSATLEEILGEIV